MKIETRTVFVNGKSIVYDLERKRVKNVNLRIGRDGSVRVSAAKTVSAAFVDAFVKSKSEFILKVKEHCEERLKSAAFRDFYDGECGRLLGEPLTLRIRYGESECVMVERESKELIVTTKNISGEHVKRVFVKYVRSLCECVFFDISERLYVDFSALGVPKPLIKIRYMKSRWGSCNPSKGVITLNAALAFADIECIEYVILHELCHFLHADHSRLFYDELTKRMPDWHERKKRLNESVSV